jgi:hypothetical protein
MTGKQGKTVSKDKTSRVGTAIIKACTRQLLQQEDESEEDLSNN